jgi:uncharacterized protein YndB with AHSA1/START domain
MEINGNTAWNLEHSSEIFPPLGSPQSRSLARDRWERLVSAIEITASAEEVWDALITPDRIALWFGACHGCLAIIGKETVLEFEDGEFILVRSVHADRPRQLRYLARWLGIGQATVVTWTLEETGSNVILSVVEEAKNPPWHWQTWAGSAWPDILNRLAAYIRTGTRWCRPWRRMGPYVHIELPVSIYEAWDTLFGVSGPKYWLLCGQGIMEIGGQLPIMMGDASGIVNMVIDELAQPGQILPGLLPYVVYRLRRSAWNTDLHGRLWIEPSGWGRSLLQAFHYNWEALPEALQLSERRIFTAFWADAAKRALQLVTASRHKILNTAHDNHVF